LRRIRKELKLCDKKKEGRKENRARKLRSIHDLPGFGGYSVVIRKGLDDT